MKHTSVLALLLYASINTAVAQTAGPTTAAPSEKPASPELASCKAAALRTLSSSDPDIKDIYFDEDGMTIATSETKIEDIEVNRIIMGQAYLRTDKSDKPRGFLCLIGDKSKVLLTFFTAR